ncbi:hypothetical protein THAOC_20747 [Thalassiosira oceanica]|uniref:Myb-like domain-containing protein n=1 Tax=Thalassiosira oceanica TaxID=159749 RepID=K0S2L8_THAOC|nr:hypothetical protein THAOC_20747 [Thalassiosira oceanica]|eukprot:EJK59079.1 hypothetical protein THAOC_20747 [Thalassiosira oceanica]
MANTELSERIQWSVLARHIPGKTGSHLRWRWNAIRPDRSMRPWTSDEDSYILDFQHENGNKWLECAKALPGRTNYDCKNRFGQLEKYSIPGTAASLNLKPKPPRKSTSARRTRQTINLERQQAAMASVADSFLAAARLTAMRNSPTPDDQLRYLPVAAAASSSSQGNAGGLITPPPLPSAAGFGNGGREESSTRVSFDDEEDVPAGMDLSPAKKTAVATSSASNHPSMRYEDEDLRGLVPVLGGGGYGYLSSCANFEA